MGDLLEAIERVRKRIDLHGALLRKSEMLTRYALIDPLLRALGWDTEDPDQVQPEISTEQGRPDYGLLWEGSVWVMVEAKSLGTSLDKARDEGFRYCWKHKVPFFVVTDGDLWELHDLRQMGGEEIFRLQISKDSLGESARKLLALWRPAMPTALPAPVPLIAPSEGRSTTSETTFPQGVVPLQEKASAGDRSQSSLSPQAISLATLQKRLRSGGGAGRVKGILRFPNGEEVKIANGRDLFLKVARWVIQNHWESLSFKLPIVRRIKKSPLMALTPDGLVEPAQVDKVWVEADKRITTGDFVLYACLILESAGVNLEDVVLIRA